MLRAFALELPFYQYFPPIREDFDDTTYAKILDEDPTRATPRGTWKASALKVFGGHTLKIPHKGFRLNPEWLRAKMDTSLGEMADIESWELGGDWWNGAFHLIDGEYRTSAIHHHWKDGDVEPRGWSGLVYLSPDAPAEAGTSIWRDKRTGLCAAAYGTVFSPNRSLFELAYVVENRFDRLVLFRENVLHAAEPGFGEGKSARLTQTFFFRTSRTSD